MTAPRRAGAGLIATVLLATGACTTDGARDEPGPRRGGAIVFGLLGEPPTLDPYSPAATELTWILARPVYPSLFRFRPDGSVVPDLASSWIVRDDEIELTLEPRRWSDGRAVGARDVVLSIRRARAPSGFARWRAEMRDPRTVLLRGSTVGWRQDLARLGFVLPRGRPRRISGGPLSIERYRPGLEVVLAPNRASDIRPLLDRITVRFVDDVEIMLMLLERGDLDAAAVPSSVNLDERLDRLGLAWDDALGWERIFLRFDPAVPEPERRALAGLIDRAHLVEGLVRADGRVAGTLWPAPGEGGAAGPSIPPAGESAAPQDLVLAVPSGDELLGLMQRAVFEELKRQDVIIQLMHAPVATFYGEWGDDAGPADVALVRAAGAPGAASAPGVATEALAIPVAHVETIVTWTEGVHGLAVNPTYEGPLWNVEEWWTE